MKHTMRFLWVSLCCIALLCVGVFVWLTLFMIRESDRTITQTANLYMEEINTQLQRHFDSLVELRLMQVEGIVQVIPPEAVTTIDDRIASGMGESARSREFVYLSLCNTQGETDVLYGEEVEILGLEDFLTAMNGGERKVTIGRTASGDHLLIYGVSVGYPVSQGYPMRDGSRCTALLTGVPIQNLNDAMALGLNEDLVFSHIIQSDGTFILRNADSTGDNYYDWLLANCQFEDGDPEGMISRMQAALEAEEPFSMVVSVDGERRHVYCSTLSNSAWSLVTVMPHGALDEAISALGSRRTVYTLGACGLLLGAVLVVFFLYFRMSRRQLAEVEQAQREAENARQEAERANRAKSEFLSNMSHDIRTPMNAIVGMTAIAAAHLDRDPGQVKDCLRKISLSSQHLLGLINDVLDMSKIESGKLTLNMGRLSLRETMDAIVSIIQPQVKEKGQVFDIFIRDILSEDVYCDGVRLNQVLLNLLSNALKFTPEGGSIFVTLVQEPSPRGERFVRTHFRVKDTGIGMSPEFQAKIFESFAREDSARVQKIEGTGLGMAITKYIVDEMKGDIQVSSQVGEGTEFHVTLDLERVDQPESEMSLPHWEMLVVDNDEALCRSAAATLEEIGVHAEWALDGESAVAMTEERHRRGEDYHVVLLDWQMPGMDGLETARALRVHLGDQVPILLISAYDWSDIEEEARAAGISGFISKPLFRSSLYYGLRPYAGAQEGPAVPPPEGHADFKGTRVLLAEDNDLNWEIAQELLSALGLELERAENGQVCLDKFRASPAGWYAAILMDIRMPVMNGYEAARAIRALDRPDAGVPIIAMTADAFAEDVQKCMDSGMNAHVAKPIDVREVARLLEKYIRCV